MNFRGVISDDLFRRYVVGITLFRRHTDDFFPRITRPDLRKDMNSKRRSDGLRGRTKVAEWPLIFPNQIVVGCDSPVQQRGNLEPLLDMTHKTNRQGRLLGASHTKKTRKVLNKEQRVKTQKEVERKWNDLIDRSVYIFILLEE
ncbi:hypothetical protein F2Q69_00031120 [Brassica cretica]|uniref:Uncharacterized protein n=1 Tax=Brassica cretica TaxID=69181 RepID=A0A8S9RX54_BRACR|nr:hypothetical protein F2Q69_00031120 [Brassica cretica]